MKHAHMSALAAMLVALFAWRVARKSDRPSIPRRDRRKDDEHLVTQSIKPLSGDGP